jgi:hypothetical protein
LIGAGGVRDVGGEGDGRGGVVAAGGVVLKVGGLVEWRDVDGVVVVAESVGDLGPVGAAANRSA